MAYWSEWILASQRLAFRSSISGFSYISWKYTQQKFPGKLSTSKLRILMSSATSLETKLPETPWDFCLFYCEYLPNLTAVDVVDFKTLTNDDWKKRLSPEQFAVCRLGGTELPHSGKYYFHSDPGIYTCVCCKQPLFSSEHKFDCACGWPTFTTEISDSIITKLHSSRRVQQREVKCAKCNSHLGHLFADGPPPVGNSFCINSVALDFIPRKN